MSLLVLGCSGRYEVGEMNPQGSGGGAAGAMAVGGSASSGDGARPSVGGTAASVGGTAASVGGTSSGATGGGDLTQPQTCGPRGTLTTLTGKLAAPRVVWDRLAPVIWAVPPGVPKDLPTQTSTAWVDKEVQVWLESDASDMGPVFVRKWLGLPDAAKLQGDYRISGPWPLLPELNMTTLVSPDVRSSPFTEPAFLSQFPSISSRGTVMSRALFGQLVPPPPPEISTQPPETDLSERIALENAIATPACLACHRLFDPLGYALSHYDGSGAYRELDKGQAIDTSGSVGLPADDRTLDFQDLPDLLSSSWATCSARLSIADNFLRIALELSGFSEQQRDQLFTANQARIEEAFVNSSLSYWSLVTAYAQTPAVLQP